jgi:hypothetical protein
MFSARCFFLFGAVGDLPFYASCSVFFYGTILFFKGGQLVDKFVGAASKATLTEKFQALL